MPVVGPRVGELPELVADHVFGDVHRHELLAVVNGEGQTDEVGRIVERRLQVLITRAALPPDARAAVAFTNRCWSTNGPFLMERAMDWAPAWRRLTMKREVGFFFERVLYPFVGLPQGVTG